MELYFVKDKPIQVDDGSDAGKWTCIRSSIDDCTDKQITS